MESRARREEEEFKEIIYRSLKAEESAAFRQSQKDKNYKKSEKYEDQLRSTAASTAASARDSYMILRKRNIILSKNTYFGHIETIADGDDSSEHFFLSSAEGLDELVKIKDGENNHNIVPFIFDKSRPFLGALMNCYRKQNGDDFVVVSEGNGDHVEKLCYHPQLIREVHVKHQEIIGDVSTLFTVYGEDQIVEYDDLFSKRLDENRQLPGMRNIIATLRTQQYEIINADKDLNFAVQGCAGSGKSQCLIHRLFYLRNELRDDGWDKVLLITPTQMFRNYSSELMKRYRLDGIANTSIADLYRMLLSAFDPRFRNRQYIFELTEEYLPDKYLHEVYAPENMARIDSAIKDAIINHVAAACNLLEIDVPGREDIDIDYVNTLVSKLTENMIRFDEIESRMSDDPEYREHREAIDSLEKDLVASNRRQKGLLERQKRLEAEYKEFDILRNSLTAAEADVDEHLRRIAENKDACGNDLQECIKQLNSVDSASTTLALLARYYETRAKAIDVITPWSEKAKEEAVYLASLRNALEDCRQRLSRFTKNVSAQTWEKNHNNDVQTNNANLASVRDDIAIAEMYLEDHSKWLQEHNGEEAKKQRLTYRAELERARYYLGRIESSVFEQEVWNELAGAKKENGIETLQVVKTKDGHQRQNRILYKSDLLFYLKIYHVLHKTRTLPDYRMICIDEGQDLHSADYELLRLMYPNAVLNIFGDTAQALHVDCGITDWQRETGVEKVFTLNNNYRNNAAIVDFCNKRFNSDMAFCGSVANYAAPSIVDQARFKHALLEGNAVVIVKNRDAFIEMCDSMNIDHKAIKYIDTKIDAVDETHIQCYSIYAAKGLEFPNVLVYANGMTQNQKIVACTRAMSNLVYYKF